jgi:Fic/DOC family
LSAVLAGHPRRSALAPGARPAAPGGRPPVPVRDGAARDIRTYDHAREPERATRLLAALDRARADAAAGCPLTFSVLSAWQCQVLGVPSAPFRRHPAFAKGGRERYGTGPDTGRQFGACLVQSEELALPLTARAARCYLDVSYFHPFDDGNARSAFLVLIFILARTGVILDQVGPIRRIQRRAGDAAGALALAGLVAVLISCTWQRAAELAGQRGE